MKKIVLGLTIAMVAGLFGGLTLFSQERRMSIELRAKTAKDHAAEVHSLQIKLSEETKNGLRLEEVLKQKDKEIKALEDKISKAKSVAPKVASKAIPQARSNSGRTVKANLSFYCACYSCTQSGKGITASGDRAVQGITIAAPSSIPFGTKITIDGTTYTVQDRGGAIVQNGDVYHFDVFVNSHEEAYRRGRFTTTATIH